MNSTDDSDPDDALRRKLEELETLLDSSQVESEPTRIKVPVLDELVTEADFIESADENDVQQIEEEIIDLAEKLEHKFSGELDQLVQLLKSNLRTSIVEELRNQANLDQDRLSSKDNHGSNTDDAIIKSRPADPGD